MLDQCARRARRPGAPGEGSVLCGVAPKNHPEHEGIDKGADGQGHQCPPANILEGQHAEASWQGGQEGEAHHQGVPTAAFRGCADDHQHRHREVGARQSSGDSATQVCTGEKKRLVERATEWMRSAMSPSGSSSRRISGSRATVGRLALASCPASRPASCPASCLAALRRIDRSLRKTITDRWPRRSARSPEAAEGRRFRATRQRRTRGVDWSISGRSSGNRGGTCRSPYHLGQLPTAN